MELGKSTHVGLLLQALQRRQPFISRAVRKTRTPIVIFDTLGKFAPWKNENDAAEVQAGMNPLDVLTHRGLAVLLNHHVGKADNTEGRAVRGSTALAGAVDIILELRRYKPDEIADRRRVLAGCGRFDEIPDEIVITPNDAGTEYIAEGDSKAAKARELAEAIVAGLPPTEPGFTKEQVQAALPAGARRTDVISVLKSGAIHGSWNSVGAGRNGDPQRFGSR